MKTALIICIILLLISSLLYVSVVKKLWNLTDNDPTFVNKIKNGFPESLQDEVEKSLKVLAKIVGVTLVVCRFIIIITLSIMTWFV